MTIINSNAKVNRAKKSTGKVTYTSYGSQLNKESNERKNLASDFNKPISIVYEPEIDPIEEIMDQGVHSRTSLKMSNLEPFIIVCQDEKLSKTQLDHLSKQWEIYELFIKELECLNKKIANNILGKQNDNNSYPQNYSISSEYDEESIKDSNPNKRIRKPKTIYSPPHSSPSTYNYIPDDDSSLTNVNDLIEDVIYSSKKKKTFLPKIKLLSSSPSTISSKKSKKPLGVIENKIAENNLQTTASINDIISKYYGKRVDYNIQYNQNNLNNRLLTPLKCSKCSLIFNDNLKAMVHVLGHFKTQFDKMCLEEYRCRHCFRAFDTVEDKEIHQLKVHLSTFDPANICMFCELQFSNLHDLIQHMTEKFCPTEGQANRSHSVKEMPFWCQLCETQSSCYIDILVHFKKEHRNTHFALCPFCLVVIKIPRHTEASSPLDVYANHVARHMTPSPSTPALEDIINSNAPSVKDKRKQIQCGLCRLNFCHVEQFDKHLSKHHETFGGNSEGKATIEPVQIPRKLADLWSLYSDLDEGIEDMDNLPIENKSFASTGYIRKPNVDLKPYMTEEDVQDANVSKSFISQKTKKPSSGVSHKKKKVVPASTTPIKTPVKKLDTASPPIKKVSPQLSTPKEQSIAITSNQSINGTCSNTRFFMATEMIIGKNCFECRKLVKNTDHFRRRKRCKLCEYSTCCYRALDKHQKNAKAHDVNNFESNHIDILVLKCSNCDRNFVGENELMYHFASNPPCRLIGSVRLVDEQKSKKRRLDTSIETPPSILKKPCHPYNKKLRVEFNLEQTIPFNEESSDLTKPIITEFSPLTENDIIFTTNADINTENSSIYEDKIHMIAPVTGDVITLTTNTVSTKNT
ncbi:zinc finger protein 280C-like isoform X2 [Gordionus sp. m RMFG-2023]|uniref:zinc finger protein 280C-like isoform X2 n=1 Tax=Gordionus sp. m RMFG-2023 TaxID=3053472 RepID=UPI0031FBF893